MVDYDNVKIRHSLRPIMSEHRRSEASEDEMSFDDCRMP